MNKYTHIIWDWNGTLLDDQQACVDAINMLLVRRQLPAVSVQQYLDIFDFPVRNYYLKLGFDFTKDDWNAVAREYHEAYALTAPAAPLRKGTIKILESLKANGIGVSILSASELALLTRMMTERGIIRYFEHIYGLADLYAASKVDLGHAFLKNTGMDRSNTLLIGDTTHDHEVAQAMGIPCLLMTGGHQSPKKLNPLGCPMVSTLDEALDYILRPPQSS